MVTMVEALLLLATRRSAYLSLGSSPVVLALAA